VGLQQAREKHVIKPRPTFGIVVINNRLAPKLSGVLWVVHEVLLERDDGELANSVRDGQGKGVLPNL